MSPARSAPKAAAAFALPLDTEPMEAASADALPEGEGWQFEPKWDGFRCLAYRSGGEVDLRAKSGKPLGRYFPEIVEALAAIRPEPFVIDGELTITTGGALSFDALQMRLHPAASRVRKLAAETPARLVVFDALHTPKAGPLMDEPLSKRRAALEAFVRAAKADALRLSSYTRDRDVAQDWLAQAGGAIDGVVAKRVEAPYAPGERAMVKVKRLRTADCVVGGFRYAASGEWVGSLLLGLYDAQGALNHVGFVSGIPDRDKPGLTKKLLALRGGPGFTGRAPGGPSRWSTERSAQWEPLKPELVVEVRFDQVTGDRFRHGAGLVRWRPDKAPRQCRMEQLAAARAAPLLPELV